MAVLNNLRKPKGIIKDVILQWRLHVCRSSVETLLVAIFAISHDGGCKMHGRGFKPRPHQHSGSFITWEESTVYKWIDSDKDEKP